MIFLQVKIILLKSIFEYIGSRSVCYDHQYSTSTPTCIIMFGCVIFTKSPVLDVKCGFSWTQRTCNIYLHVCFTQLIRQLIPRASPPCNENIYCYSFRFGSYQVGYNQYFHSCKIVEVRVPFCARLLWFLYNKYIF